MRGYRQPYGDATAAAIAALVLLGPLKTDELREFIAAALGGASKERLYRKMCKLAEICAIERAPGFVGQHRLVRWQATPAAVSKLTSERGGPEGWSNPLRLPRPITASSHRTRSRPRAAKRCDAPSSIWAYASRIGAQSHEVPQ